MTIPAAPLPSVGGLLASIFAQPSTCRTWINSDGRVLLYDRGASALTEAVRAAGPLTLWVPDYMCNEALDGVRQMSVAMRFYPLDRELMPDWEWLTKAVHEVAQPQALLAVNYFGVVDPVRQALAFCGAHSLTLIEDAAHVLQPTQPSPLRHFIVLSPRKLLSVPAGGAMITPLDQPPIAMPERVEPGSIVILWAVKRLIQSLMRKLGISWHGFSKKKKSNASPARRESRSLSRLSKRMLSVQEQRLSKIASLRRRNYEILAASLARAGVKTGRPFPGAIGKDATPYVFPLWTDRDAAALCDFLNDRGIPASRWPDLPPEVSANDSEHRHAIDLYEHVLLLPIHQTLSVRDIELIAGQITAFEKNQCPSA